MEEALERKQGRPVPHVSRRNLILLAGLVLLIAAGLVVLQRQTRTQASTANVQTVQAQRGNLQATVNTAGNIAPAQAVNLTFQQSGQVKTVAVNVGDQVKAGQVLATLDTTDLQLQVANAQSVLATAQAKLQQTQAPATDADVAAGQAAVNSAQQNLAKVKAGPAAAQVAAARAQVKAAQDNYNTVIAGPDPKVIAADQLKVQQAKDALYGSQGARDSIAGSHAASGGQKTQAQAQVLGDEVAVQQAEQQLANDQQPPTVQQVQTALAQLKTAQDTLTKLSPTAADIAAAQSQLQQAQADLTKLTQGPTNQDVAIAQAAVDQANIALQQVQLNLQHGSIVAPFDATVTAVNITPGQTVGTSASTAAIALADTKNLEIDGQLAEVDVPKAKVGQPAQISLDALPGVTLNGKVTDLAPVGTIQQGVVNYPVTVSLVKPDPAVKAGMTANVNIVVDERQNVLVVPNRAIKTQGRQKLVTVMLEGQMIQTTVQTGLSNDTMTEITSGLKEGDEVVVSGATTTTRTSAAGGPGGIGGVLGGGIAGPGR